MIQERRTRRANVSASQRVRAYNSMHTKSSNSINRTRAMYRVVDHLGKITVRDRDSLRDGNRSDVVVDGRARGVERAGNLSTASPRIKAHRAVADARVLDVYPRADGANRYAISESARGLRRGALAGHQVLNCSSRRCSSFYEADASLERGSPRAIAARF